MVAGTNAQVFDPVDGGCSRGRKALHARVGIDTDRGNKVLLGVTSENTMSQPMGTFRIDVEVAHPSGAGHRAVIRDALVDTGAALSWFPRRLLEPIGVSPIKEWRFRQADGTVLERWTTAVMIHVAGTMTLDEVVIGEPGDLVLLGARSLEGLNLRVDPVSMRLVDAGPAPAAVAA